MPRHVSQTGRLPAGWRGAAGAHSGTKTCGGDGTDRTDTQQGRYAIQPCQQDEYQKASGCGAQQVHAIDKANRPGAAGERE
jgi:hypothetical protein